MPTPLDNNQLTTLINNFPLFDQMAPLLQPGLKKMLADMQEKAGTAYNAGAWTVPSTGGESSPSKLAPTKEDTAKILAEAYITLGQMQNKLKGVIKEMGLTHLCNEMTKADNPLSR